MSAQQIEVYLGDPIDNVNERRALNRLRADLELHGVGARILANFIAGPQQRQVDLVISTNSRMVQVELKTLDPGLALRAPVNGPWEQVLPTGERRVLDRNFFRQAHDTTYALSDDMHLLAKRGKVPAPEGKFYKDIDSVICLDPDIPVGSQIASYRHIPVIGYRKLRERLTEPGPRPNWSDAHWAAFIRYLGLYPETVETHAESARRTHLQALDDYRRRYIATHRAGLHEFVQVTASLARRRGHP